MKKVLLFIALFTITTSTFAHYLWIETAATGSLNTKHEVKIRFGEYTHGVIEKVSGDAFQGVSDFKVWLISPNGTKTSLTLTPKNDFYLGYFIPTENGTYTIALDNKNMDVLDFTKYDFGIFKPEYHAKAKVQIGTEITATISTNKEGIEIIDLSKIAFNADTEVILKVLFKGSPLQKNEIKVFISDLWSKTLTTDENGIVSFKLPWKTTYTLEATYNEKTPGKYNGTEYEFIWHCATYCIIN
ncbi:MAG: DUF4198 domain-containing protein [Cellulophaga sp.]